MIDNSITIVKGMKVVVSKEYYKGDEEARTFICNGTGFGCHGFCRGQAVYGSWADGSGDGRIERYEIEKVFT